MSEQSTVSLNVTVMWLLIVNKKKYFVQKSYKNKDVRDADPRSGIIPAGTGLKQHNTSTKTAVALC